VTETRTDWHEAGDFDAAVPKVVELAPSDEADEEDANFFNAVRQAMHQSGGNVWLPGVGSTEDKVGERLVKRGWLARAEGGGYMILRRK
jgi:hypothetical protein